jgi:hypothetical protein
MRIRWARNVVSIADITDAYNILVRKSEGKRPLGRRRRRWEDNIRIDLWEMRWGNVDWIPVFEDRHQFRAVVNTVTNLRVP